MQYVAFLRAIIVGKHNRIKMADLRDALAGTGLVGVRTYLQSGNLVFESDEAPATLVLTIEAALTGMGCRNSDAVVLTRDELLDILAMSPFSNHDPDRFRWMVTLLRDPLSPGAGEALESAGGGIVAVHERAICSVVEIAPGRSVDLSPRSKKSLETPATTRYWHVVAAMSELFD